MQHALPRLSTMSWARALAGLLFLATVVAVVLDIAMWNGQRFRPPPVSFIRGAPILVIEMFMALSYAAMGWLLATRLVRNALGWFFLVIGLGMALQMTATFLVQAGHQAFRPLQPLELWSAWVSSTIHLPVTVALFALVFLIFPDGRPLSSRWAVAGWLAVGGAALVMVAAGLSPAGLIWFPSLPNPLAAPNDVAPVLAVVGGVGLVLIVAGTLIATSSMVVRYRRSGDVQRAQLRWIAVAVLLLAGGGLPFVISRYATQMDYASGEVLLLIAVAAGCLLPIAAAVAVLRHRLYDIDLIINRALVYIPLTAILGGMYTAGVAFSQRIFVAITNERSDAAIVITTLVVASMFTHLKNWLQGMVDRRFKPTPKSPPVAADGAAEASPSVPAPIPSGSLEELQARVALLEQHLRQPPPTDRGPTARRVPGPMHSDRSGL
jgi:hypothetical protein